MKRWWPGSLFGRILLVLALGLALAHALTFMLAVTERSMSMRNAMVGYLASDVASSAAVLERLPAEERSQWLTRLARRNYRFVLAEPLPVPASQSALALLVADAVAAALPPGRTVQVVDPGVPGTELRLQLRLSDGTPLAVDMDEPRLQVSRWVLAALALQLVVLVGLCAWAVRAATRPLNALADAADALGAAQAAVPLAEDGPREVVRAAAAFNRMQQRIQAYLQERMQILAAVSHDLQTPITRMRLRTDLMDDGPERDKMQRDLLEMQTLVREGVSFARSLHQETEPARRIDLDALLASIVADYADAGRAVTLAGEIGEPVVTRSRALGRVLGNLIDNAVKFTGAAELEVARQADGTIAIAVLDRGPGIPASELEAVFQPFYRLENSRNRDTGGTGLGLAIARQLAQSLGGNLVLSAREGGGLAARLTLKNVAASV